MSVVSPQQTDLLILFTRFPEAGRVKTRLIPAVGKEQAAMIHRCLTEHCLEQVSLIENRSILHIYYSGGSQESMRNWLPGRKLIPQWGNDLGERMFHALRESRDKGFHRIIIIGSDCPSLRGEDICRAFSLLKRSSLVLGPSVDGGFYLMGINNSIMPKQLNPLLHGIPWGTQHVLEQVLTRAGQLGLITELLPSLHDIDRPEDLAHFHYHARP